MFLQFYIHPFLFHTLLDAHTHIFPYDNLKVKMAKEVMKSRRDTFVQPVFHREEVDSYYYAVLYKEARIFKLVIHLSSLLLFSLFTSQLTNGIAA